MPYEKNTPWEDAPSTATPMSAARFNHMETQYDRAKEELVERVLFLGEFADVVAAGAVVPAGAWVRNNGNLYRARIEHTPSGQGPMDADGDPSYWAPVYTLDPTRVAAGALTISQVAGLQDALDARPAYVVLATEATPVPAGTQDGTLIVVREA